MTESHTLTVSQAAEMLGVSERTVWRYLKSGRLAGETVGPPGAQRTLIHAAAIDGLKRERGRDDEAADLRRRLEEALAELSRARVERDALGIRVEELERILAQRPAGRARLPAWRARASAAAGALRAARPRVLRTPPFR